MNEVNRDPVQIDTAVSLRGVLTTWQPLTAELVLSVVERIVLTPDLIGGNVSHQSFIPDIIGNSKFDLSPFTVNCLKYNCHRSGKGIQ
jgi:hypothetical protein